MPNLKRPAFHVLLLPEDADPATATDEDADQLHVVIHAADQLRGELEASKLGLRAGGKDAPMHVTMLWLWAALVRTERFGGNFQTFKARCLAFDTDKNRPVPHTSASTELDELDAHPTEASTS